MNANIKSRIFEIVHTYPRNRVSGVGPPVHIHAACRLNVERDYAYLLLMRKRTILQKRSFVALVRLVSSHFMSAMVDVRHQTQMRYMFIPRNENISCETSNR